MGYPQVHLTHPPVVSVQPASASMSSGVQSTFNVTHNSAPTTIVYVPMSNGDMIPISLPISHLGNTIKPSMVQSGTIQAPSMRMAAPAPPPGGPPGGGPPYGSGGGTPGAGPPHSGGPRGGAGSAWHPPPNSGGNPFGGFGGGGPRGPGGPGGLGGPGGGGGGGGPPFGWIPPASTGQVPAMSFGLSGVPVQTPATTPVFHSHRKLTQR
jgi:hypothetical protein